MKIIKIKPQGMCCGVSISFFLLNKAIKEYSNKKNIYLIGDLVHNDFVMSRIKKNNVIVIPRNKNSKAKQLFSKVKENSVVLLSAHGSPLSYYKYIKEKNCILIDTKCPFVNKTYEIIKQKLKQNYIIIFIGQKFHPETLGILSIDDNIVFIENKNDIDKYVRINKNLQYKKFFITNQTTLSFLDIKEIIDYAKNKIPNLEFINEICDATLTRQKAVLNLKNKNIDKLLIIGSYNSSNANKLLEIGKSIISDSIMITHPDEITNQILKNKNNIAITSAASVSPELIALVDKKINKLCSSK